MSSNSMHSNQRSVLIIEDDQSIRETLNQVVQFFGYSSYSAANGKEGLELLSKIESPCLILLDLMMPVMNGFEFLKAIELNTALNTIPIAVISAFRDTAELGKKVTHVLKKPITLESLSPVLEHHCKK